ncbi:MAG: repair protein RadC [Haloplasmataceae bacterium]|nr:repair protein RadC [Haloplasmataceae bacterium]
MNFPLKELPIEERPREKLELKGAKMLSNHELLAILLRTGTKNRSAITLAQEIICKYPNLSMLRSITIDELIEIKGIGRTKAIQILAAIELGYRANATIIERGYQIKSPTDCADYIGEEVKHLEQEHFIALYLDTKNRILAKKTLFVGSLNRSIVHPREVFKEALKHGCASIIVVHNHPSGDPTPSTQDVTITKRLMEVGEVMGIEVLDHLVIGTQGYISMKEEKYI